MVFVQGVSGDFHCEDIYTRKTINDRFRLMKNQNDPSYSAIYFRSDEIMDSDLKNKLFIGSDNDKTYSSSEIDISANVLIDGDTAITGKTIMHNGLDISGGLLLFGDASFNDNVNINSLYVKTFAKFENESLFVKKLEFDDKVVFNTDVSIVKQLEVFSKTTMHDDLEVYGTQHSKVQL